MPLQLDPSTIQKLTHESSEIRLRTFEQIWNKLNRAFDHNEDIQFKVGELCKQLIRWFGFEPICEANRVLQLLIKILRSSYSEQAVKQLGMNRFKREMDKVKLRVKNYQTELQLVDEVKSILCNYRDSKLKNEMDKVMEVFETISLMDTDENDSAKSETFLSNFVANDYEPAWSKPTPADFTALRFIADLLTNTDIDEREMSNALLHLEITMLDYPAEYMLQAPHVFLRLLHLYNLNDFEKCNVLEKVMRPITIYLRLLLARSKERSNVSAYSTNTAVTLISGNTQLKVSTILRLVLAKSVQLLEILVHECRKEMQYIMGIARDCLELFRLQQISVDNDVLRRLYSIILNLQICFEQDGHFTLKRIKYLILVCLADDISAHNINEQMEKEDSKMLDSLLRDYTFKVNFPHRYRNIEKRKQIFGSKAFDQCQKLQHYDSCIRFAVSLLRYPQTINSELILLNEPNIFVAIENLKSVQLTEYVFQSIIDCNAQYLEKPDLRSKATELLLNLMRLKHEPLRIHVYKILSMAVKRHFACLMENERYNIGLTHGQLLECQVLGVPWSSELLLHLIYVCGDNKNENLSKISEDILILILKSQHLLGEEWLKLLHLFLPILPLLQCCTQSQNITLLLQKLLDPDTKQLPFLTVLQGNIIFMFHHDSTIRSEALARLLYIMNTLPDADKYVPNLLHISDVIPNDVCILKSPREYQKIFTDVHSSYERDTLHNLLNMLEMTDVEPVIRKTTLMQLNVMCQQWETLTTFCEESAHYLILQALENALLVTSYEDYTGSAIPAISILCKVLLYDASLRCELSDTPNIYILLLRAIALYQNDIQLRQDACVCLFLLLYSSFIVVLGNQRVEAPSLLDNLQLPLNFDLQSFEQHNTALYEYDKIFVNKAEATLYLRHLLANTFYDDQIPVPKQYLEEQKNYDFDAELHLQLRDWRLMSATNPKHNIQRFLRAILNATDHKSLINASISLQLQLSLRDQQTDNTNTLMPDKLVDELYGMISKYLQLPPGNESDYELFEVLIDFCQFCVQLPLTIINIRLVEDLITDFQHAIIALLKNEDTSLRLYHKLCVLLKSLMESVKTVNGDNEKLRILHSNLFELIFQLITRHFQKRDFLRIRCLLSLQATLSTYDIAIADRQLMAYCKRFIKLSLVLKSFTQTGSQWQIDCLTIVCRLYTQLEEPQRSFKLCQSSVKYLSGLCGHCDRKVRALAWCILTYFSRYDDSLDNSTTLTTDGGESIVVRQLAANLFTNFLSGAEKKEDAFQLLTRHKFLFFANEAIRGCCIFEQTLPLHFDHNSPISITNCDLISCFCKICSRMLENKPDFAKELCESDFMLKLYELMKMSPADENPKYYVMCGEICRLYGACYPTNFSLLQRTLCRDQVWLKHFYQLFDQPDILDAVIVNVLQLLLVLCKDDMAYEKLCDNISKAPASLVRHLLRAFAIENLNTPLQRCSLAALSLLLIKGQNKVHGQNRPNNIVVTLERNVAITDNKDIIALKVAKFTEILTQRQYDNISEDLSVDIDLVENENASSNSSAITVATKSAIALIFVELFRLFQHLYSIATNKFTNAPTKAQVQVSETLGVILRISVGARLAAKNLKLFDKITQIFDTFFEQFKCSATTYVRRYGENKKLTLIKNFKLLLNVYLHWFAAADAALTDNLQSVALSKLIMQLWPWLPHSGDLKELVLQVCCHHSEHSFAVCKQFAMLFSGYAHSLLQLVIKLIVAETTKVKANNAESFPVISTGLRIVMNCCSCAEGRVTITKALMLDMFDSLHPFHLKSPKVKADILRSWLQFWELFSRYPEGAHTRNLRALCDVIIRSPPSSTVRILTLRILRNMCFLGSNRSALMTSNDFICTIDTIVGERLDSSAASNAEQKYVSYEEQLIACVGVWKLASGGAKYVAMLRCTNLAKQLRQLNQQLQSLKENNSKKFSQISFATDLSYVLDVILNIFNN
ncbi:protein rotatin homolog [Bactrocera dorsalis]|uniref:Protein rotatin homolog n=1 Tax=Bactrocera dorsalis TaxID=27457 RepID=A0ABM3K877_BACDO|nr:protein rotatin homolog [Bactrocera dorsalis]